MSNDQQPRLNTNQFMALRSIAREPWDVQSGRIQWRFNGKWFHLLRRDGAREPLESVDGVGRYGGYGRIIEAAWDAAWELQGFGLVEVFTVRCCPGRACHANDRPGYTLTPRGAALLQKANAANRPKPATPNLVETPAAAANLAGASWWRKAASFLRWRSAL